MKKKKKKLMSLTDNLFSEDVEESIKVFLKKEKPKRVLIFPPCNNYQRFLVHKLVQDNFLELTTFSIGQGLSRRIVICYKSDFTGEVAPKVQNRMMGIGTQFSPTISPEHNFQKQRHAVKLVSGAEIYRPPALRQAMLKNAISDTEINPSTSKTQENMKTSRNRQKRPDRAVYVPRHRRNVALSEKSSKSLLSDDKTNFSSENDSPILTNVQDCTEKLDNNDFIVQKNTNSYSEASGNSDCLDDSDERDRRKPSDTKEIFDPTEKSAKENSFETDSVEKNLENRSLKRILVSDILVISDIDKPKNTDMPILENTLTPVTMPEKKVKKIDITKTILNSDSEKTLNLNKEECDWESLFDDNGECLDPSLLDELTSAVGEVAIEKPKCIQKTFSKPFEVLNDEFSHVIEIYNFPSEFKTCDLASVFSPFKNGGFELKWVDDTHCLGVFSSSSVAAEVLALDHPLVKTRPLSEATMLSKLRVRKSSEFLQPFRNRPETCAALARRLVTGALGVKLKTAKQEREQEKIILREAKERRRLANKQREDAWEGIFSEKALEEKNSFS